MSVRLDPKGKFFTEAIKKNPIRAVIETTGGRIEGTIYLHPRHRLLDDLHDGTNFLAVTDICTPQAEPAFEAEFIALNVAHIIWIQPIEENTRQLDGDE